jgi:hypothetical protein
MSTAGTSVIPGDVANVGLCAIVTVALQLLGFAIAFFLQIDTVTDFFGSTNFILLALLTLFAGPNAPPYASSATPRALALTILVILSRAELAAYLLYRVRRARRARRISRAAPRRHFCRRRPPPARPPARPPRRCCAAARTRASTRCAAPARVFSASGCSR